MQWEAEHLLSLEKQVLYLISSADSVDARLLIEIYGARGIDHQIVRNALSKLKKDGYAVSPERSRYSITPTGLNFITTINRKPLLLDQQWDGRWMSVLFDIPETERKKRDAFRDELLQLGFGALYKSVYISPWNYEEEVVRSLEIHGLGERATIAKGVFVHGAPTPRHAKQLWRLDALNEVYRTQIGWLHSEFRPTIEPLIEDPGEGLALFGRFLELGERMADLSLKDPMLPEELLEEDWLGRTCFREMQESLFLIANGIPASSLYRVFVLRYLEDIA